MDDDEDLLGELGALTNLCSDETEHTVRKRATMVMKVPMLLSDELEPLKTILICLHQPEERILIVKDFEDSYKRERK
jgi:GTP-sensing pleiotropic transcriptional regulator CodY